MVNEFYLIQYGLETKGRKLIRRVRTPAGVRHYGQPIGSIIVRDPIPDVSFRVGERRQTVRRAKAPVDPMVVDAAFMPTDPARSDSDVQEMVTDYENTRKWKVAGRRGRVYTWQEEDGSWVLADHQDNVLEEGDSEEEVIAAINKLVKKSSAKKTSRKPRPTLVPWRPATDEDLQKIAEETGMKYPNTHVYRSVMQVADIEEFWKNEPPVKWIDKNGKVQGPYTQAHRDKAKRAKFEAVRKLAKVVDQLDDYLEANWQTDPVAAAVLLMRKTGIRPSSPDNDKGDQTSYGITTMQARHVTVNQNSVRLQFTAKKGVDQDFTYRDEQLVEMFRLYKGDKKGRAEIFDGVGPHAMRNLVEQVLGKEFVLYNLRHLIATEYAIQLVEAHKRPALPKNKTEFNRWRREVGKAVSEVLGNNPSEALDSYIDPGVFSEWEEAIKDA